MVWIRKNPFDTDPKIEMIKFVSEQANLAGASLTDEERTILASENPDVDQVTEQRLRALVRGVIVAQRASGEEADRKSFVNAVEWVTDLEYPYVVALAEAELTGSHSVDQVVRRSYSGMWVIGGSLAVAALIIVLFLLARRLF